MGEAVLLDRGKLESALARPLLGFGGVPAHRTPMEKAGALLLGLCAAHAFDDGNKRTAWISTVIYLEQLGFILGEIPQLQVADFVEDVAVRIEDIHVIAEWFVARLR